VEALIFVVLVCGFVYWVTRSFAPRSSIGVAATARRVADTDAALSLDHAEGGLLKPLHRRRLLRDPRLRPGKSSTPSPPGFLARADSPPPIPHDQLARLLSGTLRTRNHRQRELSTDLTQLLRYALPVWDDEDQLAQSLGIDVKRLRYFSIHRERERVVHYVRFTIPKRNGTERLILAPKRELKALQRQLNELLVHRLPVSEHAHGFVHKRSIATHAALHVGKQVVVKLDIKDFFPAIHVGRVRGLLIALGYGYPVAATLAALMTEADRQPVKVGTDIFYAPIGPRHTVQGAPTSPGVANCIALTLDRRLAGLARRYAFTYSRYADDLTFSGNDKSKVRRLLKAVGHIVQSEGFALNPAKTRVMTQRGAQRITGVTVNRELGLPRRERRKLRAELHQARARKLDAAGWRRLSGKIAYLAMLSKTQARALLRKQ
jgi:hypothetical protein